MKNNDYVKLYANSFGLDIKNYNSLNIQSLSVNNNIVGWCKLDDNKYFSYLNEAGNWSQCKTSDLLLAIFNNIPIHKQ